MLIGNIYLALGSENEAYQRHADAYEIGISLYGPISPRVFFLRYKMAWYDFRKGKTEEARCVIFWRLKLLVANLPEGMKQERC